MASLWGTDKEKAQVLEELLRKLEQKYRDFGGRMSWEEYISERQKIFDDAYRPRRAQYMDQSFPINGSIEYNVLTLRELTGFPDPSWAYALSTRKSTSPSNAATMLWDESNGVMVCECDNPDCFETLVLDREEYIQASGPEGHYRVTSPKCAYGCKDYRLVRRLPSSNSWSR